MAYLQLFCALCRLQPTVGLHSELPAAGPWTGLGAVCSGGPRSCCQKRLCGPVHATFYKPSHRCLCLHVSHVSVLHFRIFVVMCNTLFHSPRLSTCSFTEGGWFQPVPCHTLYPCQSDPQRCSCQKRVWAYSRRQRQSMTHVWVNSFFQQWRALDGGALMWWETNCCRCCCLTVQTSSGPIYTKAGPHAWRK